MEEKHKALKVINRILDAFCVFLFVCLFLLVVIQVVSRYVFNDPLPWTEELSRFALVWMVFFGSIATMRDGEHIEVNVLISVIPKRYHFIFFTISKIFVVIFMATLIYLGVLNAMNNMMQRSSVLQISMGYAYLCIPISAAGMLIYSLTRKSAGEEK